MSPSSRGEGQVWTVGYRLGLEPCGYRYEGRAQTARDGSLRAKSPVAVPDTPCFPTRFPTRLSAKDAWEVKFDKNSRARRSLATNSQDVKLPASFSWPTRPDLHAEMMMTPSDLCCVHFLLCPGGFCQLLMLRGYFLLKVYLCACAPSLTEEDISQAPLQGCRATHSCAASSYEPRSPTALAYAIIVAQSLQACLQRALAVCLPGHLT
ncbi:hypothetical protein L1887_59362 [Cichorium endivia]|nr:hypothetical protein L1887_59362 [Cichorium endivia]